MPEIRPAAYDSKIEGNVIFTRLDAAMNWMRKNSLWPMPMGLACCAIELMATAASRFDISRFGAEVMRFSPRQCDVMIVAGTVTYKMALAVKADLRTDAGTEMGDRNGRLRFNRRDVSVVRGLAGDRSIAAGRRLRFGVSAAAGSVARRSNEVAGKRFRRSRSCAIKNAS